MSLVYSGRRRVRSL
ncbi:hypothetical protein LINPERPRIM_LOCUS13103 [Linum perenne]